MEASKKAREESEDRNNTARDEAKLERLKSDKLLQSMLQQLLNNNNSSSTNIDNHHITPPPLQTNITNNHTAQQVQIYGGGTSTQNTITTNSKTTPPNTGKVKRNAKSMSNTHDEHENTSPERQKQRQNNPVPTEIDFEKYAADITTDMEIQYHFQQQPYNHPKEHTVRDQCHRNGHSS
jgi:hypothetical protein